MSVRLRLMLIVVFVALVPLGISALLTFRIHQQAFDEALGSIHRKTAENAAARAHALLAAREQDLERLTTKVVDWVDLSPAERDAALWLVYREHPDVVSVSLRDRAGREQGRPAFVVPETASVEPDHPVVSPALVERLIAATPTGDTELTRVGEPLFDPDLEHAVVPVEIPVHGPDRQRWVVLVMLSLQGVCSEVRSGETGAMEVLVLDEQGRALCAPDGRQRGVAVPGLTLESGIYAPTHYKDRDGLEMMQSSVQLPRGWWAVAQRPSEVALAPSQRMRWLGAYCRLVSLIGALVIGSLLARSITEPLQSLMDTAKRFGQGQYEARVVLAGGGELSALGDAFDRMRVEIRERDKEIREFNDKLQERVDAQTAQLKQAQEHLLSSQKHAVLSTLSSGIATEVNNPLTGVLGRAQRLRSRTQEDPSRPREGVMLLQNEQAAQRIRTVMMGVLALSN
jgi:HAMP domain-containing protein